MSSSKRLAFILSTTVLLLSVCSVLPVSGQVSCMWEGYNFTSLTVADMQGSDGSSTNEYFLRVCGVLTTEPPCLRTNPAASACQTNVNPPVVALVEGVINQETELQWNYIEPSNPSYGVQYTISGDETCVIGSSTGTFFTNVQFICNPTQGNLVVQPPTGNSCVVNYTIETPLACNGCIFNGMNFQSLGATDLEYQDPTTENKYFLNVCGSIQSAGQCVQQYPLTSACQMTYNGQFNSVGEYNPEQAASQWFFTNSSNPSAGVTLQMSGAPECYASGAAQDFITEINFECAAVQGSLTVVAPTTTCIQTWSLPTPLACGSNPPVPVQSCGYGNFNFSSLMGADIVGSDGSNVYSYYLNVCGSVESQPSCTSSITDTSACQVQVNPKGTSFSIGDWSTATSEWSYIQANEPSSGVLLQMTGAQECWLSGTPQNYYANIMFVCSSQSGPLTVVAPAQSCSQNWTYPTPLACIGGDESVANSIFSLE